MPTAAHRSWVLTALLVLAIVLIFSLTPAHPARTAEATFTAYTVHNDKGRTIHVARRYLGHDYNQYTWSCSDYTSVVFQKASYGAIVMPDWDNKQTYYGRPTAGLKDPLKRADLVFFDENLNDGDRISHVAIYAGHGYVYQSSSYWGSTVKTYMPFITNSRGLPAYKPQYTRRIRW